MNHHRTAYDETATTRGGKLSSPRRGDAERLETLA